jgi:predicted aspartyl protease
MTFPFLRDPESGLLLGSIEIDHWFEPKMVLDTGCTHTTIDSNALYLLGYDLEESKGRVEIETANGIIETDVFELGSFSSLGITKKDFQVQVYDFLAHGIFSDYNGLLGLDFFESRHICVNLPEDLIDIVL